jgi:histidine ammonia-lyase
MTVVLTGRDLTRDRLVRVARGEEEVELDPGAIERMGAARLIVETAIARGDEIYGSSTGVGVLKRVGLDRTSPDPFSERMIRHHLVGLGPPAPVDVARATMLRLANEFAGGAAGVRPELAQRLIDALNGGAEPGIRTLGSIGQADLAPMADLAVALFSGFPLAPGEGLALLNSNAFTTGWAALALSDTATLLDTMGAAGALSLEAIVANVTMLHPAIAELRPYPGIKRALGRLTGLLRGSFLWEPAAARSLQDPLTFRNLPQILGALHDAFDHTDSQLAIELNASQGNPVVIPAEKRVISVANFEILPLAAGLDLIRIVLATALTAASERVVKLLETPWSGLPTGLAREAGTSEPGLSYLGIASQALTAEARLLAQPVSFEMASSAHAEGIEDRATMAPLGVRRLVDMLALGRQIVARELAVAAQAVELRGLGPLGRGTGAVLEKVRATVPFLDAGDGTPPALDDLAGAISASTIAPPSAEEAEGSE